MSSNAVWKKDASGVEHPAHELILAFMRGQCSEHEKSRISGHLLAGCVRCNELHAGLTQESAALNQLKHMSRYLYYPELQPGQVLLHAQRGEPLTSAWTGKRKRKFQVQSRSGGRLQQVRGQYAHKANVRFISIPVAFAILLLFMVVLALAYTFLNGSKAPLFPWQQQNSLHSDNPSSLVLATQQAPVPTLMPTETRAVTVTATPTVNATEGRGPTPTATVVVAKGPTIETCPPPKYTGMYIFICGYNFKVGDQVSLVLEYYGNRQPVMRRSLTIDKLGEFMDSWNIYSCQYLPMAIYAVDVTQKSGSIISNTLTPVPMASCDWPTPTVTPGGHS